MVNKSELIKGRKRGMISEIDVKEVRSTYHSFDVACEFAGNDRRVAVVYKITGPKKKKPALDVSPVSHNPGDQESLLPSTGKYR